MEPLLLRKGVDGELAIAGPCVALGYVGRPELTSQRFFLHPLMPDSGERLYRTGDRVQLRADRKIAFHGRIDTQVKHRRFRIEFGEIESRLYNIPEVQAAAVILANAGTEMASLEAFVVVRSDASCEPARMQKEPFQSLPAYMRPQRLFLLGAHEMSRLTSGKINAKALHEVSARKATGRMMAVSGTEVGTNKNTDEDCEDTVEITLSTLASLFPESGVIKPQTDIFADIGGHSVQVAELVSLLRSKRSVADGSTPFAALGMADVYEGQNAANILAQTLSAAQSRRERGKI